MGQLLHGWAQTYAATAHMRMQQIISCKSQRHSSTAVRLGSCTADRCNSQLHTSTAVAWSSVHSTVACSTCMQQCRGTCSRVQHSLQRSAHTAVRHNGGCSLLGVLCCAVLGCVAVGLSLSLSTPMPRAHAAAESHLLRDSSTLIQHSSSCCNSAVMATAAAGATAATAS